MKNLPLDATAFHQLLTRAHLKLSSKEGVINECLLKINSTGIGSIQAVDAHSRVLVESAVKMVKQDEIIEPISLGLRDLPKMISFLNTEGDYTFAADQTRIRINRKGRGSISLQLLAPKEVPTTIKPEYLKEDGFLTHYKDQSKITVTLTVDNRADTIEFPKLLGDKLIAVEKAESGIVSIKSGNESLNAFAIAIDNVEDAPGEAHKTIVESETLIAVLKAVQEEGEITIHFADNRPLVIELNEFNFWVLTPLN